MEILLCSAYFGLSLKIFCIPRIFNKFMFPFITLYPQDIQVSSCSLGSERFRLQCLQRGPYFLTI